MKFRFLLVVLGLVLASNLSFAQTNPEKKAKDAFKKQFPYATKAKWGEDEKERFEVTFKLGDDKWEAVYDKNGNFIEQTRELRSISEMPFDVSSSFEKAYPEASIVTMHEVKTNKGQHQYTFDYKPIGKGAVTQAVFTEQGKELEINDED